MAPMPASTIGGDGSDQKGTETKENKESTVGQDAKELVINQDNWHDTKLLGVKEWASLSKSPCYETPR